MFANVDTGLAAELADYIGVERSSIDHVEMSETSPSLSVTTTYGPQSMRVGVLVGEDFDEDQVGATLDALEQAGAFVHIISDRLRSRSGMQGTQLEVDETFLTSHPMLFDAYYIVGGTSHQQQMFDQEVCEFFAQAYTFLKLIGVAASGECYANLSEDNNASGVVFVS